MRKQVDVPNVVAVRRSRQRAGQLPAQLCGEAVLVLGEPGLDEGIAVHDDPVAASRPRDLRSAVTPTVHHRPHTLAPLGRQPGGDAVGSGNEGVRVLGMQATGGREHGRKEQGGLHRPEAGGGPAQEIEPEVEPDHEHAHQRIQPPRETLPPEVGGGFVDSRLRHAAPSNVWMASRGIWFTEALPCAAKSGMEAANLAILGAIARDGHGGGRVAGALEGGVDVALVDTLEQFEALRPRWDQVHAADPDASSFDSWSWLRGFFVDPPQPWCVLIARRGSECPGVAFLTLGFREIRSLLRPLRVRELVMGGFPLSDHVGFVAQSEHAGEAIPALARFVRDELAWDRFALRELSDPRIERFLSHFPARAFSVVERAETPRPYLPLPESWEAYLAESIGRYTRRDLRRAFRAIEADECWSINHAAADTLEPHIDALLALWKSHWSDQPGSAQNLARFRHLLRHSYEAGRLWLAVLWDRDKPVAALAAFTDRRKKVFSAYLTAYDAEYSRMKAGKTMYGHSIERAIAGGYEEYDFGRGDQQHKELLGGLARGNRNLDILRRTVRARLGLLLERVEKKLRYRLTSRT